MHQVTERVGRGIVNGEMVRGHLGVELQFGRDGTLTDGIVHCNEDHADWAQEMLTEAISSSMLRYLKSKPHKLYAGDFWARGKSRLGGVPPEGLVMPPSGMPTAYHYAGTLSRAELGLPLSALRADVHLIWPFLEPYQAPFFLDVSNPLQTKTLPQDQSATISTRARTGGAAQYQPTHYGPLSADVSVTSDQHIPLEFEEDRFSMVPTNDWLTEDYITVRGGGPSWVLYPESS